MPEGPSTEEARNRRIASIIPVGEEILENPGRYWQLPLDFEKEAHRLATALAFTVGLIEGQGGDASIGRMVLDRWSFPLHKVERDDA